MTHFSVQAPSIMDIDYSAIGREEASRCENLNEKDFVWIDDLQMPTVDEEFFTSISSNCLTNQQMLDYLHGDRPTEESIVSRHEDDRGINMSSVTTTEQTSFITDTTNGNMHCVINVSESSEEEHCNDDVDVQYLGDSDDQISQVIMDHSQSTDTKIVADDDDDVGLPLPQNCNHNISLVPDPLPIVNSLMSHKVTNVNSSITDTTCPIPYRNNETAINMNVVNCPILRDATNCYPCDTGDTVTLTFPNLANSSNIHSSQHKHFHVYRTTVCDESVNAAAIYDQLEVTSSPFNESHLTTTLKEGEYVDHNYDIAMQEDNITSSN